MEIYLTKTLKHVYNSILSCICGALHLLGQVLPVGDARRKSLCRRLNSIEEKYSCHSNMENVEMAVELSTNKKRKMKLNCTTISISFISILIVLLIINYWYTVDSTMAEDKIVSQRLPISLLNLSPDLEHGRNGQELLNGSYGDHSVIPEIKPNLHVEFVRAVVAYFPLKQADLKLGWRVLLELRWLHHSWEFMLISESLQWRTDLIIVSQEPIHMCQDLRCVDQPRETEREPSTCRCIHGYKPYTDGFPYNSKVQSFATLLWNTTNLHKYDWIFRCPLGSFLTPAFATWKPRYPMIGRGHQISRRLVQLYLQYTARNLGLEYSDFDLLSRSWYGPVKMLQKAAEISIEVLKYLNHNSAGESQDILGQARYIYSSNLAINHLMSKFTIRVEEVGYILDELTTSSNYVYRRPHLRTWNTPTNRIFNRKDFFNGVYHNRTAETLDITVTCHYALYIANVSTNQYSWPVGEEEAIIP